MVAVKLKPIKLVLWWKGPSLLCFVQCKQQRGQKCWMWEELQWGRVKGGRAQALLSAFSLSFKVMHSRNAFSTPPATELLSIYLCFLSHKEFPPFPAAPSVRLRTVTLTGSKRGPPPRPNPSRPALRNGRTSAPGAVSYCPRGSGVGTSGRWRHRLAPGEGHTLSSQNGGGGGEQLPGERGVRALRPLRAGSVGLGGAARLRWGSGSRCRGGGLGVPGEPRGRRGVGRGRLLPLLSPSATQVLGPRGLLSPSAPSPAPLVFLRGSTATWAASKAERGEGVCLGCVWLWASRGCGFCRARTFPQLSQSGKCIALSWAAILIFWKRASQWL